VLEARGLVCSMSRRGNRYDNAVAESVFSTVKSELADRFDRFGEAKVELFGYIEVFYNQQRRHSTLGRISPAAFERRFSAWAAQLTRRPNRLVKPEMELNDRWNEPGRTRSSARGRAQ
jgi:transposase InsO family protein